MGLCSSLEVHPSALSSPTNANSSYVNGSNQSSHYNYSNLSSYGAQNNNSSLLSANPQNNGTNGEKSLVNPNGRRVSINTNGNNNNNPPMLRSPSLPNVNQDEKQHKNKKKTPNNKDNTSPTDNSNKKSSSILPSLPSSIDRQLLNHKNSDRRIIKILFLGCPEGGKSTIFRQLRMLHSDNYKKDEDRMVYRNLIWRNVMECIMEICVGIKGMGWGEGFNHNNASNNNAIGSIIPSTGRSGSIPGMSSRWDSPQEEHSFLFIWDLYEKWKVLISQTIQTGGVNGTANISTNTNNYIHYNELSAKSNNNPSMVGGGQSKKGGEGQATNPHNEQKSSSSPSPIHFSPSSYPATSLHIPLPFPLTDLPLLSAHISKLSLSSLLQRFTHLYHISPSLPLPIPIRLPDSTNYFLTPHNITRILTSDYVPSQDDILRSRSITLGINECDMKMEKEKERFRLVDVGGQRGERKKWIHIFDQVSAIIFIGSLAEYNEYMWGGSGSGGTNHFMSGGNSRNNTQNGSRNHPHHPTSPSSTDPHPSSPSSSPHIMRNKMEESLDLFETIVSLPWFKDIPIILFLNKNDIFQTKILTYQIDLGIYFPRYTSGCDYAESLRFIQEEYFNRNPNTMKVIYCHVTEGVNRENIQFVWKGTRHIILEDSMKKTAQMM